MQIKISFPPFWKKNIGKIWLLYKHVNAVWPVQSCVFTTQPDPLQNVFVKGFYQAVVYRETKHCFIVYVQFVLPTHRLRHSLTYSCVTKSRRKHRLALLRHHCSPRNEQEWLGSTCTSVAPAVSEKDKSDILLRWQHRGTCSEYYFSPWILTVFKREKKSHELSPSASIGISLSSSCRVPWALPGAQLSQIPMNSVPQARQAAEQALCLLGAAAAWWGLQPMGAQPEAAACWA